MNDDDRDSTLKDIQVNSAVTREKVESMDNSLQSVQDTLEDHETRLQSVESKTARNSYLLGGIASTVGAALATLAGKITKYF